jgi:hypothetical protein
MTLLSRPISGLSDAATLRPVTLCLREFLCGFGRLQEAAASFQRAVRINPKNYLNYYMHGAAPSDVIFEAAASLRMALKLNPTHADSNFGWGSPSSPTTG